MNSFGFRVRVYEQGSGAPPQCAGSSRQSTARVSCNLIPGCMLPCAVSGLVLSANISDVCASVQGQGHKRKNAAQETDVERLAADTGHTC